MLNPVDDGLVGGIAEHPRPRVPRLGVGGDRADLDVAETECGGGGPSPGVLVEARGEPHGVRKGEAEGVDRALDAGEPLVAGGEEAAEGREAAEGGHRVHAELVRVLRIAAEERRPHQLFIEAAHSPNVGPKRRPWQGAEWQNSLFLKCFRRRTAPGATAKNSAQFCLFFESQEARCAKISPAPFLPWPKQSNRSNGASSASARITTGGSPRPATPCAGTSTA